VIGEFWILLTAVIFTAYGWWVGNTRGFSIATEAVIDKLIADGYLRCKTDKDGEDHILKWNSKE
jgi:hypothetical protein